MLHVIPSKGLTSTDPALLTDRVRVVSSDQVSGVPQSEKMSGTSPNAPSGLDLSKRMSIVLREGTIAVHDEINGSPAAQLLSSGELAKSEYIRFLFMLWHIYDALERALFEHREHPVIFHIYHPRVFSRATALSFDICHLLGTVTWQTDPFYITFYNDIPAPVQAYCDRIAYFGREGAPEEDVNLLASHAYVRYLGDLSGGQIIRKKIIKAYNLYDDGDGIAFYNFRTLDPSTGDRPAEPHEIRKIKDWFKAGLDEAVTDSAVKVAIIEEANRAFVYNSDIFKCLDGTKSLEMEPLLNSSRLVEFLTSNTGTTIGGVLALVLAALLSRLLLSMGGLTG